MRAREHARREPALERCWFGYHRLHILLTRGITNHKKLRRLIWEGRLQVRRRSGRKSALGSRASIALPQGAQSALKPGFRLGCFRQRYRFRIILAIVDDFTRPATLRPKGFRPA
jgi:putative transposase